VAQQPLTHLRTVPHSRIRDDSLFDASGFHKRMTLGDVDRIAVIVPHPGVPEELRRSATLLRTFVRSLWAHDVIGFNRAELDAEDLDGFLFGAGRTALRALVDLLRDLQKDQCFCCNRRMDIDAHIDHVMPWSIIPIDGVANLVATDVRCTRQVGERTGTGARVTSSRTGLPAGHPVYDANTSVDQENRVRRARVYAALPVGSMLWCETGRYETFSG